MTKSNFEANQVNQTEEDHCEVSINTFSWYVDIVFFLRTMGFKEGKTDSQKITIRLQSEKYILIKDDLYWKNKDGILLFCLDPYQSKKIFSQMHRGVCGGHFSVKTNAHKILRVGYFWPIVFKDSYDFVRKCEECQKFSGKLKFNGVLPMRPMQSKEPFQMWGIDFIGEITDKSSGGNRWILVAIDYFSK